MKIKLDRKLGAQLNHFQMKSIVGGVEEVDDSLEVAALEGEARSDRRTGHCAFSRKHGIIMNENPDGTTTTQGCYPAGK